MFLFYDQMELEITIISKKLQLSPHFVPEGISSSLRDFIFVLNIEVFQIKFSK